MCGISGIVDFSGLGSRDKNILENMNKSISHRGPDASGVYLDNKAAIGHVRLSIIDLAGGQQPMSNESGSVILSFNGEVYNYKELRKILLEKGYSFKTQSDTEVVLKAYEEYGSSCFEYFNGMFAIALWDKKKEELVLAKDRFGKKPLYYSIENNRVLFSSELKSLSSHALVSKDINTNAVSDYFTLGYITTPNTIYKNVNKLRPASYITISKSGSKISKYWSLDFNNKVSVGFGDAIKNVDELLETAVKSRLVSDVPFGAFLSGGIDSSLVVRYMQKQMSDPVHTFSIGFDEDEYSEVTEARQVSRFLGTNHTEYIINSQCADIVDEFIGFYDEPFGDSSSLPTYYVSKLASEKVKMVLTGDAGDECFGGYKRYTRFLYSRLINKYLPSSPAFNHLLGNMPGYHATKLADVIKRAKSKFPENYINEVKLNNLSGLNKFLKHQGDYDSVAQIVHYFTHFKDDLDNIYNGDINTYMLDDILVKVDRMSMANSIEIRSPLLDYRLLEYSASLPSKYKTSYRNGKLILRELAKMYLPGNIAAGKKKGFAIPLNKWFRKELGDMLYDLLSNNNSICEDLYDRKYVYDILKLHRDGKGDFGEQLWLFLSFERWADRYGI